MISSNNNIAEIRRLIEAADSILVTSHMDGDGDSIGTQLAVLDYLEWLGKKAVAAHESQIPSALRFLPGSSRLHDIKIEEELSAVRSMGPFDLLLVLECPNPSRMGAVWDLKAADAKVINIDHHHDNTGYGDAVWLRPEASSVGELMAEYFEAVEFPFAEPTAEALYAAILTDTGRFQYPSASPATFAIVADIVKRGIDIRKITDSIYFQRTQASLKLLGVALAGIRFFAGGQAAIIELTPEMFQSAKATADDSEGIVEYTLMATGAEVGALVRSYDGKRTKVSLRSRGQYDVSEIAAHFGGGGHAGAAGCTFESSTAETMELVISKLKDMLALHTKVEVHS